MHLCLLIKHHSLPHSYLYIQIDPQSGADGRFIVVDLVAELVDVAISVDNGSKILKEAGRPQPPQAVAASFYLFCYCSILKTTVFQNKNYISKPSKPRKAKYGVLKLFFPERYALIKLVYPSFEIFCVSRV